MINDMQENIVLNDKKKDIQEDSFEKLNDELENFIEEEINNQ